MNYYLLRWGTGEGCDYTIGCNERITKLKAQDIVSARTDAEKIMMPDEPEHWEAYLENEPSYLKKAMIVQETMDMRVEDMYDACRAMTKARVDKDNSSEEKKEYERLKKKFGE